MLTLLIYFFTLLSYNQLQRTTLVEARIAPIDGFVINLFNRYSPNSPSYSPSASLREHFHQLVVSSASRHRFIKQLQDKTVDTTVIPNEGDYLMKVSVGTPAVELTAVASTGSDITWFQCQPCDSCYRQSRAIFDPNSSKTYKKLTCDSRHCSELDSKHLSCDQKNNECRYRSAYRNGTTITMGIMGSDTFSFNASDKGRPLFRSTAFGCGYEQHGLFDGDAAGLVGLGGGPFSLVSQLGPRIGYKFSYCLASSTSGYTSKLRFGNNFITGEETSISTPYMTKDPPSFYNLNLTGISIDKMSLQMERDIVIDIGTTLTYLNPTIFSSLEGMVSEALGTRPIPQPLSELLCYDQKARVLTPPDIVFNFSGGDLVLKAKNVFIEFGGFLCLSIVKTEHDDEPMVFGNMAQVNLEVEYDLLNKMVTFSQNDCTNDTIY